jgi:DNA sulfur modification protein DndC
MGALENLDLFQAPEFDQVIPLAMPLGFNEDDSTDDKIAASRGAIKALMAAGKHLVVAFSAGKDSSVLLAIAIQALEELIAEQGTAPRMFVITSNTLLENPLMDNYSRGEIAKIQAYARSNNLPIKARIATPNTSNNYLVNIIGGRLIASTPDSGRQCTVMMKVQPIQRLRKRLAREMGYSKTEAREQFVTLIGKRYSESESRGRGMHENGERPDAPVKIISDKAGKVYEWVMSPIAQFTLDDVYMTIAYVRNNMVTTYSNFEELVEIYRSANEGSCMINVYAKGKPASSGCGSRTGCHVCLAVKDDYSMDSMLKDEQFAWMRPLNDFRNYIQRNHYRIDKRNWLARTVNDDGSITLAPNAYAPQFCLDLLRYALTIDANEQVSAARMGIEPRFQLLRMKDIIAIDFLWARYGYQHALMACHTARLVQNGKRWVVPAADPGTSYPTRLPSIRKVTLPFADSDYGSLASGSMDVLAAVTGSLNPFAVPTGDEFTVDEDGAEMFWGFELDYALNKFGPVDCDGEQGKDAFGAAMGAHYFLRMGTVSLFKGSEGEFERMMQVSNQISRHGIRGLLNDPEALIAKLGGDGDMLPVAGSQYDIEDLIRLARSQSSNRISAVEVTA